MAPNTYLIIATNYACHAGPAIQTRHDIELGLALHGIWKILHSKLGLTANVRVAFGIEKMLNVARVSAVIGNCLTCQI